MKLKRIKPRQLVARVAPRVGAWIETAHLLSVCGTTASPLAWGRGLKLLNLLTLVRLILSPLAWGRGLKLVCLSLLQRALCRPSRGGVD